MRKTTQVRVYLSDYEVVRKMAFKAHKPMTEILAEIIKQRTQKPLSPKEVIALNLKVPQS